MTRKPHPSRRGPIRMTRRTVVIGGGLIATIGLLPPRPARAADAGAVTAQRLLPLRPIRRVFRMTAGIHRGERAVLSVAPAAPPTPDAATADRGNKWVCTFGELDVIHVDVASDGAFRMSRMDLPEDGYTFVYDRPRLLLPASVHPGSPPPPEPAVGVKLYEYGADEVDREGEAEHRVESVELIEPADTDWGRRVYRVKLLQRVDVGIASIEMKLELDLAAGFGLVRRAVSCTTTKFGLISETQEQEAVLLRGQ